MVGGGGAGLRPFWKNSIIKLHFFMGSSLRAYMVLACHKYKTKQKATSGFVLVFWLSHSKTVFDNNKGLPRPAVYWVALVLAAALDFGFVSSLLKVFGFHSLTDSSFSSKSCCLNEQVAKVQEVSPLSLKRCVSKWKLETLNYADYQLQSVTVWDWTGHT